MDSGEILAMDATYVILFLIPIFLLLLFITLWFLAWHSGLFLPIDIKTCKSPFSELEIAYKFVRGSHKDSSLVYAEAHSLAPQLRCIGVYYDNPKEVGDDIRRSVVGVVLNDEGKEVPEEERQRMSAKGFQITKFPAVEYVVYTEFPHYSFLSVLIAINKVVPKFYEYLEEKKLQAYPLIEMCDGEKIVYISPLSKQSEFFVYEALAESEEEITSEKTADDEETSAKDLEELPDTISSIDSLIEGGGSKVEELPSNEEVLDSLEEKNKTNSNGSDASTESFEELQLDS
ncbi:testis-expressed protein 264 homolog [Parasteatoda tepidariorum]|uniref:testis-expressed protein 264 homolog n=1 Tax=Parasteatoda tepidariorum TaxID=114398 RepID=UPI00077FBA74|nr:testis-expressed protein 264 homolog [Parasteatoda tepidariorum]